MEIEEQIRRQGIPVEELIRSALEARKKSYAPYSGYQVGAAVLTKELRIYTGSNIENAAYSPTICGERVAVFKAVSEGRRGFLALAVVGGPADGEMQYAFPCGVCRQVLREFADPRELVVIVAKSETDYQLYRLSDLLPESFGPDNLK